MTARNPAPARAAETLPHREAAQVVAAVFGVAASHCDVGAVSAWLRRPRGGPIDVKRDLADAVRDVDALPRRVRRAIERLKVAAANPRASRAAGGSAANGAAS